MASASSPVWISLPSVSTMMAMQYLPTAAAGAAAAGAAAAGAAAAGAAAAGAAAAGEPPEDIRQLGKLQCSLHSLLCCCACQVLQAQRCSRLLINEAQHTCERAASASLFGWPSVRAIDPTHMSPCELRAAISCRPGLSASLPWKLLPEPPGVCCCCCCCCSPLFLVQFPDSLDHLVVPGVVAVCHIEASNIHAVLGQEAQHLIAATRRANGADQLCPTGSTRSCKAAAR
jgi:hypothetical protein